MKLKKHLIEKEKKKYKMKQKYKYWHKMKPYGLVSYTKNWGFYLGANSFCGEIYANPAKKSAERQKLKKELITELLYDI